MFLFRIALSALFVHGAARSFHPSEPAKYQTFPSLREQAHIQDGWRQLRLDSLPQMMKEYNINAWLVSLTHPTPRKGLTERLDDTA